MMMMMIMVVTKGVAEDGRSNGPGHWIWWRLEANEVEEGGAGLYCNVHCETRAVENILKAIVWFALRAAVAEPAHNQLIFMSLKWVFLNRLLPSVILNILTLLKWSWQYDPSFFLQSFMTFNQLVEVKLQIQQLLLIWSLYIIFLLCGNSRSLHPAKEKHFTSMHFPQCSMVSNNLSLGTIKIVQVKSKDNYVKYQYTSDLSLEPQLVFALDLYLCLLLWLQFM